MKALKFSIIPIFVVSAAFVSYSIDTYSDAQNERLELAHNQSDDLPFSTTISVENIKNQDYYLSVNMDLDEGAYFASPFDQNNFKGVFKIEIEAHPQLKVDSKLIEDPIAPETTHANGEGKVRFVTEKTNYKQRLTVNSIAQFVVKGQVSTVIEPICNRYVINFELTCKDGVLSVTQAQPVVENLSN